MNKNQLKALEAKLDEQKAYIQELESRLNVRSSEIIDNKNILAKTHDQIKKLNDELNDLLNFILMLEEEKLNAKSKGVLGLQEYMRSTIITEDKNLLFGLNIDKKFIQNRSIPTIKYYLYTFDCFIQEEHQLQNLKISHKKDLTLIVETLNEYIKLSFKNKNSSIKGIVEIVPIQSLFPQDSQNLTIKFYGNHSIEEEIQNFITLYSQKN
ncbi:hypothetical protein BKH41_01760 [Helicobacter sp. 12S02232-10]|uniref:hypothetical protein n=1 Tax=Helicobacter sp. 12S02232-10 TaxID=1476197 RepID=UPI000BA6D7E6|nr:hypothetical protein [Helicobacter sp. 12S02232-10]PAF49418.1 hypothetical protein BKH41_01760 [Helicobacter sp. 12S02232-10]